MGLPNAVRSFEYFEAISRVYFEPPVQALFRFARMPVFAAHASELGGYDVARNGDVIYNA